MKVHYSSKSVLWSTPQDFFNKLNKEFDFNIDVCALPENAKCDVFYTPEIDGLKQTWTGTCWMNPPYGREIKHWIKKAAESAKAGATVVCLLPARVDTKWFHDFILDKAETRFVKGRLYFGDGSGRAPFPSMVVIFRPC